jgi:multiple sugar transport system permease protein
MSQARGGVSARVPRAAWWAACLAFGALFVFPLYLTVTQSLKTSAEAAATPPTLLPHALSIQNYLNLNGHAGSIDVAEHLLNSLLVAVATSAGTVVLATLAGYGFARLRFPGGGLLFMAMLAAFMIPFQAIITPLYVVLHVIGLSNSLVGLTLVYITFQLPFGLFLMRNSFAALPADLEESAQLDGCSLASTLWRVMLPLAVPGVVTTALFSFFTSWNEFFAALILITDQSKFTLPVVLSVLQTGQFGTIDWGVLEAGVVLSAAPCVALFLLLQKYYVGGLLSGAVK